MEMDVETVNVIEKKTNKQTNKQIDDNFPWSILDNRLTSKFS